MIFLNLIIIDAFRTQSRETFSRQQPISSVSISLQTLEKQPVMNLGLFNTCYLIEAEATIRNTLEYVKNQQKNVLDALEKTPKGVSIISPAF